jgi:hypothetical protein
MFGDGGRVLPKPCTFDETPDLRHPVKVLKE